MADKHPYISSSGALVQVLDYLRKSFPASFNSETLKKLSLAPGNESYILNILRFLGFISEDDARTESAQAIFTLHADDDFHKAFSKAVEAGYKDLFSLHQGGTWALGDDKLIPFFRQSDKTSEIVGTRQASTFRTLSVYAGHEAVAPAARPGRAPGKSTPAKKGAKAISPAEPKELRVPAANSGGQGQGSRDVGLTVRIEINLPATGDQETYDKIFKSIKENFLNA